MAKKVRKAAAKRGKKSKVKKTRVAKKAKPARTQKRAKRKAKSKAKPKTIGQRISSGYHVVVDTVTGTGRMRNKMEKPGTDETE